MPDPLVLVDQAIAARGLSLAGERDAYRAVVADLFRSGFARPPVTPAEPVQSPGAPQRVWDRLEATERALRAVLVLHPEARSHRHVQAWERLNQGAA